MQDVQDRAGGEISNSGAGEERGDDSWDRRCRRIISLCNATANDGSTSWSMDHNRTVRTALSLLLSFSHFLTLSLSLCHSLRLCPSVTVSLSVSVDLSVTHSLSLSLSLSHCLSQALSYSLTQSLSLSLSLSHCLSLSVSIAQFFSHCRSFSPPLISAPLSLSLAVDANAHA